MEAYPSAGPPDAEPHANGDGKDRRRDDGGRDRERRSDRDRERSDRDRDRRDDDRRHRDEGRRSSRDRRDDDRRRRDDEERRRRDDDRRRRSRSRDRRRDRSRDRSPRKRRSETPEDRRHRQSVTPLHLRKRKLNNWDVPPPGYEHLTAEQVKATGMYPVPGGVSRPTGPQIPLELQARGSMTTPQVLNSSATRQSRRLYVGNVPYGCSEDALVTFFNNMITQLGMAIAGPGVPCIAAQINHEKNYAFAEFRSAEEASAAVTFDGITFQNQSLKIKRPKDYMPPNGIDVMPVGGAQLPGGGESPNKIYLGNLPNSLGEDHIRELLVSFGELKFVSLVTEGGVSKGFAFAEYLDPNVTDVACTGLNGLEIGDRKLVVQRATGGGARASAFGSGSNSMPLGATGGSGLPSLIPPELLTKGPGDPTTVVFLLNMVTPDELADDLEYQEILEDIKEEVSKFGQLQELVMPRPGKPGYDVPGVGKIFIQYETPDQAAIAVARLAGRKFADRTVIAGFYDEDKFARGEY